MTYENIFKMDLISIAGILNHDLISFQIESGKRENKVSKGLHLERLANMPRMSRQSPRTRALAQRARDAARAAVSFDSCAATFENIMQNVDFASCVRCRKRTILEDVIRSSGLCRYCNRTANNLFSEANNMAFGSIPEELKNLTLIEQILIARVHPVVSVFKIRGQQRAYSGHVMNFVQHMARLATRLPMPIRDITTVVLLNRETPAGLVQFRVRAARVRAALVWLKQNNQYYSDIVIDEVVLSSLPNDGDVSSQLPCLNVSAQDPLDGADQNHDNLIHGSCFPSVPAINAAEVISNNLRRTQEPVDIGNWPELSANPVDEFRTEGYICRAFPVLFPYGRGDLHAPRLRTIPKHNYFKYLMKFHDGRFAKDERFPYFAYNTLARWDALNCGNVYVRHHTMEGYSAEDIVELANDPNSDLAASIMYYGANLRGTRSFWKQRCSELVQMVRQLGTPTIFFTLSAADYHWPDLFRILLPGQDSSRIQESLRRTIMHENPAIVAWFFEYRSGIFMKKFMNQFFPIKDFWYRFEWQHRGSPHIHGLLWLDDAPDCNDIDSLTAEQRESIVTYFDQFVSATIGDLTSVPPFANPCRVRFKDIPQQARAADLDRILSAVQRHSRCGTHCLRKPRGSSTRKCRYGFPFPLEDNSILRQESGSWKFFPKRNDALLQRYNRFVSQVWRGNTDFSAITSKDAVLNYVSKYAAKGEHSSEAYSEILRRVINRNPNDAPAARLIRQLLISSVAERNYSAQEIMHLVLGWPLYHASRSMTVISLSEDWRRFGGLPSSSIVNQYSSRDDDLDDISLYDYAKNYYVRSGRTVRRRKECIARVIPHLKLTDDPESNEAYYKQQCKLYLPWRGDFAEILPQNMDWFSFYESRRDEIDRADPFAEAFPHVPDEVEFEDEPFNSADIIRDAGMAASRINPQAPQNDPLGRRVVDEAFSWNTVADANLNNDMVRNFLTHYKSAPLPPAARHLLIDLNSLSAEQREVVSICEEQVQSISPAIKRVIVQGKAGTGKSTIIRALCQMLSDHRSFSNKPYVIAAPTGAAALNVDGVTLHSFFRLPINGPMAPLNGQSLRDFQLRMADVKFIIIDEYSMVGMRMLHKIHKRLCEARGNVTEPFGGFFIYLFGDLRQLPPVKDSPIYAEPRDDFARVALGLIGSFQKTVFLTTSHRQRAGQEAFRRVLDNIGRGQVTRYDWELLMTRRSSIAPQNRSEFRGTIHLFPKNQQVDELNTQTLAANGQAVALIDAEHNNATARQASSTLAGGLQRRLYLSIGCRVMLRQNICVERALVNGSLGTVRDIVYQTNSGPPGLPYCILVEFDKYIGPFIRDRLFPILPTSSSWREQSVDCQRRQFPLNLAYALTIHKSQGLTLDRAIVDIGDREMAPGLTYVALSRVRKLEDLLLSRPFNFNRLHDFTTMPQFIARERFIAELESRQRD